MKCVLGGSWVSLEFGMGGGSVGNWKIQLRAACIMDRLVLCGDLTGTRKSRWAQEGSLPQLRADLEEPVDAWGR